MGVRDSTAAAEEYPWFSGRINLGGVVLATFSASARISRYTSAMHCRRFM